jgi:hypothetical protein
MKRLGLVYGAIDLRLTPEGRYIFLEINPAGQFLHIEYATGQPIAAALAQSLLKKPGIDVWTRESTLPDANDMNGNPASAQLARS